MLALAAWLAGHGALAWCAVDRCTEVDPDHTLAGLVGDAAQPRGPALVVGPVPAGRRRADPPGPRTPALGSIGMGEEVDAQEFSRADRTRYREKVRRCLDVFARMLREARFDTDDPMTGLEVELNLVDERGDPALKNAEALAAIADPDFQTELGQFNIEINVPPAKLREGGLSDVRGRRCGAASTTPRPSRPRSAPTW